MYLIFYCKVTCNILVATYIRDNNENIESESQEINGKAEKMLESSVQSLEGSDMADFLFPFRVN